MTKTPLDVSQQLRGSGWSSALRMPLVMGLAGLLALQLLLAAVSGGSGRLTPAATDTPLVTFDATQAKRIEISTEADTTPLVLSRTDSGWVLQTLGDFPAATTRVESLLDTLAALRRPLPIATSAAARERFKVADDAFAERLVLSDGQKPVATLILGDSPGFRRRYLRPAGDEGVYDVRFEVFNLSAQPNDWIAHDQLQLERDQIQRIATADWTLVKADDTWSLSAGENGSDRDGDGDNDSKDGSLGTVAGQVDTAKVDELLSNLANLSYREVLGTTAPAGFDPESPRLVLDIGLAGGDSQRYLIADAADAAKTETTAEAETEATVAIANQDFVLKSEQQPYYFLLSEFDLGSLLDTNRADLITSHPDSVSKAAAAQAATESATEDRAPALKPVSDQADSDTTAELPPSTSAEPQD
ncbi:DUF4340 domain-containing protein [Rhabdochromatium marinum]|uniref:DUF4340 domain-containing protein n=1 Tax=Rhabdochromatium marinum TaxID=48729 RepID=UPI0019074B9D|nr:DUF4340 domain-containing protein [Rhabdochromatium marinum]MBK1647818.1 hypothetical protein [Rhabdochromatium marinum]